MPIQQSYLGNCLGFLGLAFLAVTIGWAQTEPPDPTATTPASPPPSSSTSSSSSSSPSPVPAYQPKFKGDPARSESEAQALGYMRVVLRAQREYKKKHDKFAPSLASLAGTGTFTRRMAQSTNRGDYTASFQSRPESSHPKNEGGGGFILTMTPKQMDAEHRSFYAEDDGVIHADDQKPADQDSPKVN
jgi:type II secretory pathway pseudopilin PulG